MRVSAKADYAVRAALELAAAGEDTPIAGDRIADAQHIPLRFLQSILGELHEARLVFSQQGTNGGYWLARPPAEITLAEVIRAVDGPLASVHSQRPEELSYDGPAAPLRQVWLALRTNIRGVLEAVTLADVVAAELPPEVRELTDQRRV